MSCHKQTCGPCLRGDTDKKGVIYCIECQEPLCEQCAETHKRIKVLTQHKLCKFELAPPPDVSKTLKEWNACPVHNEEDVVFICKDHDNLCCSKCAMTSHRKCDDVQALSDIFSSSQTGIDDLQIKLQELEAEAKMLLNHEENQELKLDDSETEVQTQLKMLKKKLIDTFNVLEEYVLEDMREKKHEIKLSINKQKQDIDKFLSEIQNLKTSIDNILKHGQKQHCVIMEHKLRHVEVKALEKLAADLNMNKCKIKSHFKCKENTSADQLLSLLSSALEIEVNCDEIEQGSDSVNEHVEETTPHLIADVSLKGPQDSGQYNVKATSCVWIDQYIVVAIVGRNVLEVVDEDNLSVVFTYECEAKPVSLLDLGHRLIAACFPENITLLQLHNGTINLFTEYTTVPYNAICRIASSNKFICVHSAGKAICMLNEKGEFMKKTNITKNNIRKTLQLAKYCTFIECSQTLYVSCFKSLVAIKLFTGEVVFTCDDVSVFGQAAVDPKENILMTLSSYSTLGHGCVFQMNATGQVVRTLSLELPNPCGICFNDTFDKFAVCNNDDMKTLNVYSYR